MPRLWSGYISNAKTVSWLSSQSSLKDNIVARTKWLQKPKKIGKKRRVGRKCSGQHISFSTPSKDASNLLSRHRALRRQSACHPPAGSSGPPGDLLVTREDASWRTNQRPADLERSLNAFPLKVGEETAGLSLVSLINVTANRKKKKKKE